jgi:hypothetical protein
MQDVKNEIFMWGCITNATLWSIAGNWPVAYAMVGMFVFFRLLDYYREYRQWKAGEEA